MSLVLLAVADGSYLAGRRTPVEWLAAAAAEVVLAILGGDLRADVLTAIVVGADLSPAHEEIIELRRRG